MPTFNLKTPNGLIATSYTPLRVIVEGTEHTLALHRLESGAFRVSDPASGMAVLRTVNGSYRGMPTTTHGRTLGEVKELAAEQVRNLANSLGAGVFAMTLRAGIPA